MELAIDGTSIDIISRVDTQDEEVVSWGVYSNVPVYSHKSILPALSSRCLGVGLLAADKRKKQKNEG